MATWEFTSEHASSYDTDTLLTKLNDRAGDGWELVTIISAGSDVTAFMKREKPAGDDEKDGKTGRTERVEKEAVPVAGGLGSLAAGAGSATRDDDKAALNDE